VRGSTGGTRRSAVVGGLPQLKSGSGGVPNMSEAPDTGRLDNFVIRVDTCVVQLGEHRVKIADAEVEHHLLLRPAEVVAVLRERRPHTVGPASCCQTRSPCGLQLRPRCCAYQAASRSGSLDRKKTPPMPVTRSTAPPNFANMLGWNVATPTAERCAHSRTATARLTASTSTHAHPSRPASRSLSDADPAVAASRSVGPTWGARGTG